MRTEKVDHSLGIGIMEREHFLNQPEFSPKSCFKAITLGKAFRFWCERNQANERKKAPQMTKEPQKL